MIIILLGQMILWILAVIALYIILTLLATIIPVNKNYTQDSSGIVCYLSSDGIHTDFILPINNEFFNWAEIFDSEDYENRLNPYGYVGIGWGDRGFFLDIPTWNDLTLRVATKALLIPSDTLLHIIAYDDLPTDKKKLVDFRLKPENYLKLCNYICSFFELDSNNDIILLKDKGYHTNDNFYVANSKYHAFNTCNYWINRGLIMSGVRTSIWSPVDWGIFYQIKKSS